MKYPTHIPRISKTHGCSRVEFPGLLRRASLEYPRTIHVWMMPAIWANVIREGSLTGFDVLPQQR